jgi:hypothetical protein
MLRGLAAAVALCGLAGAFASGAEDPLTKREADSLEQKVNAVLERGARPAPAAPLRTIITDREVNAYFKFQGAAQLPVGVLGPTLTIGDAGRVVAAATVDLDAVRRAKERAWSDPLAYISGLVVVRATGRVSGAGGRGKLDLESATLEASRIPGGAAAGNVATVTPESPGGFMLDHPSDLPAASGRLSFNGTAVIVQ